MIKLSVPDFIVTHFVLIFPAYTVLGQYYKERSKDILKASISMLSLSSVDKRGFSKNFVRYYHNARRPRSFRKRGELTYLQATATA